VHGNVSNHLTQWDVDYLLASDLVVQYNLILIVIIIQDIGDNAVALLTTSQHKLGANVSRVILRSNVSNHCLTHCNTLSNVMKTNQV
jgi:hypothetical protein